ncbi:YraN family protein [Clostridium mediterraneense]|uniref:YraN family protein n=1 Tax=Clostridium mediterraneense TaxID=1805472 RepID=UPI0008334238|nr:YraN family protein [Clostridium mediterraneense]
MKKYNKLIGDFGEDLATKYLKLKNYTILDCKFNSNSGEIDIIAKDKDILVFIEVKTRFYTKFGLPVEAVNYIKSKRIINTAKYYLYKNNIYDCFIRFDIIEIILSSNNFSDAKINHIEDAFRT